MLKSLFGVDYDDVWKAIIRPPKDEYKDSDLGPAQFLINDKLYLRNDFVIKNKRGHKLACSYWEPKERPCERLPCVVYLHGNSSSRCEAVPEAKTLLPMNITYFAFDFSACGHSEGEYISLGWFEREDVECVIEYLRKSNKVSTIGLWGRSMGAVTALMYGNSDPTIAGMVLDSPFSSLKLLVEELVKSKVSLPGFIVSSAIKLVKGSVKKMAKFDLTDIEPIKYAECCFIPALFCAAKGDDFVGPHHSKKLFDVYQGDKNITTIDGDHNSSRPKYFRDSAGIFFYNSLQVEYLKQMSDNYAGFIYKKEESQNLKKVEESKDDKDDFDEQENLRELEKNLNQLELEKEKEDIIDYGDVDIGGVNGDNDIPRDIDEEEKAFLKALEESKQMYEEKLNKDKTIKK